MYDPTEAVRKVAKVRYKVMAPKESSYESSPHDSFTAKKQYTLVRSFDLFLYELINASDVNRNHWRNGYRPMSFTTALYKLHMDQLGHIAHYDACGFFNEQYNEVRDVINNLTIIAQGKDLSGYPMRLPKTMVAGLKEVAEHYLTKFKKL